ncbi:hypothetical protein [Ornithinibacillus sp. FSL M8-0202]|uniref:hypothetical protein n=1 Tax=Ornithinibacillus sp. FSL M8-0202 TaxID=2921616 RepID=UPI0030D5B281
MREIVKEFFSPSKIYKVEIIKRTDGLYTTEVSRWFRCDDEYTYEYWSPIKKGLSLIDTEENAIKIGIEQLKELSGEKFTYSYFNLTNESNSEIK